MPSLLVIRLHPVEPVTGDEFTNYLNGLSITAHDLSFTDPTGATTPALGPATYIAPTLPPIPPIPPSQSVAPIQDPNTRIVQHFTTTKDAITLIGTAREFLAVATAVIQIPDPPVEGEYRTADIRLVISRNVGGTVSEIVHKQTYYNVPVRLGGLPVPPSPPIDPNVFITWTETSLHLALPSSGSASPTVILPEDGIAPNFTVLRTAVEAVLAAEPGIMVADIADLTLAQCRHIAYEIIWDRMAYPLPVPKQAPALATPEQSLARIYTKSKASNSDDERDRRIFEGDLLTYYTRHNAEAERLKTFIFSLSTAIWCEDLTRQATRTGFHFPVFPNPPKGEAKVILKASGAALNPSFEVPAAYFYALTATLPSQLNRQDRFKMVALDAEVQIVTNITQAIDDGVLTEPALTTPGGVSVNRYQAARRLRALGSANEIGTPEFVLNPVNPATSAVRGLVTDWLGFTGTDINAFWTTLSPANTAGHLDLILCAITKEHPPLAPLTAAIKNPPVTIPPVPSFGAGVTNVDQLAAKNKGNWEALLNPNPALLPEFTKPGTTEERTQSFIRHLRKFFDVTNVFNPPPVPTIDETLQLSRSPGNPLDQLLANYPGGFSFSGWDPGQLKTTVNGIFPSDSTSDPKVKEQFIEWLTCIKSVVNLTNEITPIKIQFSVIEALWARGFTNGHVIGKFSNVKDFTEALAGSVAYDYAETIWKKAILPVSDSPPRSVGFKPINPDGSLINCIPPAHLSPLGPIAYLHDLLQVSSESTCKNPLPKDVNQNQILAVILADHRTSWDTLLASKANLEVPLPLIDIVNESLEYMVAHDATYGVIYNTASDTVGGHELTSTTTPTGAFQHDPEKLFEALPEHSTPAVPTDEQSAYDKLKNDFSSCLLPYSQPLDVSRTYLEQLGTSRFATMRRFREEITEFVLDPTHEPTDFQKHLWRYPVRIKTAIEYLKITPEEYTVLFQDNITIAPLRGRGSRAAAGKIQLYTLYGFASHGSTDKTLWTNGVVHVSEFLERTCLTYCEFIELWKSEFVKFGLKNNPQGFPDCEPCCLDKYIIDFQDPKDTEEALKRLAIFIRLWRKLQAVPNARYTFTELTDICNVLELFDAANNVNPDFIRQLVAFQMFRDDFQLRLTDGTPPVANATGAERLHLLAFWVSGATKWNWAIEHLLYQIQQYSIHTYHCRCREPEFIKLLMDNLNSLSALAGFDPNNSTDTWHAHPTHTLRFAEILAKIYASEFGVGELLFLFTNDEHLQGDDPFPLQPANEAKDSPLSLPDDDEQNSLWKLRQKLMAVVVSTESAQQWTWTRMETTLRDEFGFSPPPLSNHWLSLGQHFFPSVLADSGIAVSTAQRQYRVSLPQPTPILMWNTPPAGPFPI